MKVVLLKDVSKLGRKYEVKEVSNGHALNFLIPQGSAVAGTPSMIKKYDLLRSGDETERKIREDLLIKNLKDAEGVTITLTEKANEKGHLFAGIHKEAILAEMKKETRLDILPQYIELEKPIHAVGEYDIDVKILDKKVSFKLIVKAAQE